MMAATHNSEFGHEVTHVTNVGRRQPRSLALRKSQGTAQTTAQTIRAHIVTHIRNVWRVGGRCHFQPLAISSKPLRRSSGAGIDGAGARVALLETIGRAAARPLYVFWVVWSPAPTHQDRKEEGDDFAGKAGQAIA